MEDSELWKSFKAFYNEMIAPNKTVVLICLFVALIAYFSLFFLPRDNPIEQAAEKVIEEETGFIIDLTP